MNIKTLIIALLYSLPLCAQTNCQNILSNARNAAANGNYKEAIDKYTTAVDCDAKLSATANIEIKAMFDKINKLKDDAIKAKNEIVKQKQIAQTQAENALKAQKEAQVQAENAKKAEEKALKEAENARKAKTQADTSAAQAKRAQTQTKTALQKAKKLIDAFYFYDDKFALAYGTKGDNNAKVFYFINKNGDEVSKLGKWSKAEQFDDRGFAKVEDVAYDGNITRYLLDTLGNSYRVAYDLKDLSPDILP